MKMKVNIFGTESTPVNAVLAELYVAANDPILLLAMAIIGWDTK
jgi:hypothetical protein